MNRYTLHESDPKTVLAHAHAREINNVTVTEYSHMRACNSDIDVNVLACARVRYRYNIDDLAKVLRIPFLRPHQRTAVEAATSDRDVLMIAPTGAGKSEAFLGVGLVRGGLTLVVSPLRSLIADQRRRCEALGLPVLIWNSDVSAEDKDAALAVIRGGWEGFFYTTPESLNGSMLSDVLRGMVTTAVVDEAHCCLRERAFRVCYAFLGSVLDRIGPGLRFACTATLPREDRAPVVRALRLSDPITILAPVSRGNLHIHIVQRSDQELVQILNRHAQQAGIVFCATVRAAEQVRARLVSQGRRVALYHGRLSTKVKRAAQDAFMSGQLPVAITTDAFLLGIDKADLRFVVHYDYPKSVEDWVQGFGRAGRDGLSADVYGCFLGSSEGLQSRKFLIDATFPPVEDLRAVWTDLCTAPHRDGTAGQIARRVLGRRGEHSGSSIMTTLRRFRLVAVEPHPDDRRRRRHRGDGDFNTTDWTDYARESSCARQRFERLCALVRLDGRSIPVEIERYFEADASEGG